MKCIETYKTKLVACVLLASAAVGCGQKTMSPFTLANPVTDSEVRNSVESDYLDSTYIEVNADALRAELLNFKAGSELTLALNLPAGKTLRLVITNFENEDGASLASGHVENSSDSKVQITISGSSLLLTVKSAVASENFEIRSVGEGRHVMGTVRPEQAHDCEVKLHADVHTDSSTENTHSFEMAVSSSSPVINILVVYTPAARKKEGGAEAMKALATQSIMETNEALRNSGLAARVKLVGTKELSSDETGNYSNDLAYLANKKGHSDDRNGKWDEAHAYRNQLGADQVTLLGSYAKPFPSGVLGLGYKQAGDNKPAVASSAFTVTKTSAARRYYTVTHELGHNLGLDHTDGYASTAGKFQTIIRKIGAYTRVLHFSSPAIKYKGYVTGTSNYNEAKTVEKNAVLLSNYR